MTPEEIRIECLRLAVAAQAMDPIEHAKLMADFVFGNGDREQRKE